ncbi:MAG TPA: hypothetical protein VF743_02105, partial [Acidimicrobiales bacterium]
MGTRAALVVSAGQAVAYRLAVHQLDDRLPAGWLAEAAGPVPLQDTGRSSPALSLAARVDELVPAELERALLVDRRLVR